MLLRRKSVIFPVSKVKRKEPQSSDFKIEQHNQFHAVGAPKVQYVSMSHCFREQTLREGHGWLRRGVWAGGDWHSWQRVPQVIPGKTTQSTLKECQYLRAIFREALTSCTDPLKAIEDFQIENGVLLPR